MADLHEILDKLDRLLEAAEFDDYGPNGLQVEGRGDVEVVATGVSASAELFERGREKDADLVLVHHGILWRGPPKPVDRAARRRLELLFAGDVSLVAYHLPLDGHMEVGNAALIARALGADELEGFGAHHGRTIGARGTFPAGGVPAADLRRRVEELTGRMPLMFDAGPDPVRTIGIVTGGGSGYLDEAISTGLDAFLTGEPTERVMIQAREAGIHYVAAGHYATETFGVRRLGELLSERFGLRHVFIDVPNPI
jgi:dinuclear metal center YbgI/SA1388 family protein